MRKFILIALFGLFVGLLVGVITTGDWVITVIIFVSTVIMAIGFYFIKKYSDQKSNDRSELEIKKRALEDKLQSISTETKSKDIVKVLSINGDLIEINTQATHSNNGRFCPSFKNLFSCPGIGLQIYVGVGKDTDGNNELWFLEEGKNGIAHFQGGINTDFKKYRLKAVFC